MCPGTNDFAYLVRNYYTLMVLDGTELAIDDKGEQSSLPPLIISKQPPVETEDQSSMDFTNIKNALPNAHTNGNSKTEELGRVSTEPTSSVPTTTYNSSLSPSSNGIPRQNSLEPSAMRPHGPEVSQPFDESHHADCEGDDELDVVEGSKLKKKTMFNSKTELKKKMAVDRLASPLFNTAIFRSAKSSVAVHSSDSEGEDCDAGQSTVAIPSHEGEDTSMYPKSAKKNLKKQRSQSYTGVDETPGKDKEFFPSFSMRKQKKVRTRSDVAMSDSNDQHETANVDDPTQFIHSDTEVPNISESADTPVKKRSVLRGFNLHQPTESGVNTHTRRNTMFLDHSPTIDWKDLKNSLKFNLLRTDKKKKETIDNSYLKSAELISELSAGAPAAIILASMFQRDDRNTQRIPVLLEQIKLKIKDISPKLKEKNRHYLLELEYGSGPARLRWSVRREFKDFWSFHSKFKVMIFQGNIGGTKFSLPKFPARHSIFQKIQRAHKEAQQAKKAENIDGGGVSPHASIFHRTTSGGQSGLARQVSAISEEGRSVSSMSISSQSLSSVSGRSSRRKRVARFPRAVGTLWDNTDFNETTGKEYVEALRVALEKYILELFKALRFRADANRLFQFLEVSNMTIRLAPESSFHGKEGYLILRSSATLQGWRVSHWRPNDISQMVVRHTSKWYMVRESYILCVKDISDSNILEVFLVDPGFKVTHGDSDKLGSDEDTQVPSSSAHITFQLENLERKMKLVTNSRRQLGMWMDSINQMKDNTVWSKQHRFNSFAPVRTNVQAQWFVDAVSIALLSFVYNTNQTARLFLVCQYCIGYGKGCHLHS